LTPKNGLNKYCAIGEIQLQNYTFTHKPSSARAGGAALYIQNCLNYSVCHDICMLSSNCESLCVKIKNNSSKFIYLGVIYRHPNHQFDDFEKYLNDLLTNFNLNNNECIIPGDFNIDLFKCSPDNKTGRYHLNLESYGCKPLITESTRFSSTVSPSLLDHIYCKLRNINQIAVIAIFDVSYHLPIFLLLSTSVNRKSEKQIIRCTKNFNLENFLIDIDEALSPWNFNTGSTVHNDFISLFIFFKEQ